MHRNPVLLSQTVISAAHPFAVLEILNFQDDPQGYGRAAALTVIEGEYRYSVCADRMTPTGAALLLRKLPIPDERLDGLGGTVTLRSASFQEVEGFPGLVAVGDAYIKVFEKGKSDCEIDCVYPAEHLGDDEHEASLFDIAFPEHAVRRHLERARSVVEPIDDKPAVYGL